VTTAKSSGGLNSAQEWAQERRGRGVECSGLVLAFYRGRGKVGEATTGGNWWLNGLQAIDGWGG
jgi:hypothetical protein